MTKISTEVSLMRNALIILLSTLALVACAGEEEMASSAPMPAAPLSSDEVLANVQAAMGTENLSSITVSGRAWSIRNSFRQTRSANPPWISRDEIMHYVRTIDLAAPASLASGDTYVQNLFYDPQYPADYTQNITAQDMNWSNQLNIWLTPWGFLQGAETNGVSVSMMDGDTVLSWISPENQTSPSGMRYTVNAHINDDNLISMTETWVEDDFMGNMRVSAVYRDYEEMDGVMVPATSEIWQGGGAIFGVALLAADANPTNLTALITPPPGGGRGGFGPPPGGAAPSPADLIEEVAPGVYHITTNYNSLAVEFEDGFIVFESGGFPPRANAGIIMEAVASVSEKPITAVINSHPHSDHTPSLIPMVSAGIPLIVSENSVDFLRMALSTPRTLLGEDTLNPEFQVVPDNGVMVIEDSMNRLEIHHVPNIHTDSMLFAYLPEHRLAIQADFTIRADDNDNTLPWQGQNRIVQGLAIYVDANGLEFDTLLGVHAPSYPQDSDDVLMALPDPDFVAPSPF
ncbi:MAG: MBL fold metallo-hydrolase [Flavobacteriaceae bacterium]|nr:MBL fold metallo-hydrolase [Flavobacteriaceae bacterium]